MKRVFGIGQVVALATLVGCGTIGDEYVYQNEPERRAYNQQMMENLNSEQIANAVIRQQTVFPHHFHSQSPALTEVAERDLMILANHYKQNVLPYLGENNVLREVKIHFDYDASYVRPNEFAALDEGIELLKSNPKANILVTGRADIRGSVDYNEKLAAERAMAVEAYLAGKGVDPSRIQVMSRANLDALALATDEEGMEEDRHAIFRVAELSDYPVSLSVRRGGVSEPLYELRKRSVRSFLSSQGVDPSLISIDDGLSAGSGIPSEQGALFLISTYAAERENTPTKKTITGKTQ